VNAGTVYLLHFDRPFGLDDQQHYIGWTRSLERRIAAHRAGEGCRFTARVVNEGIGFQVVRIWTDADRGKERALKGVSGRWLCPMCIPMFQVGGDGRGGECFPVIGPAR
jgi:predicted GIY-YIG superfamily endonuclease